MKVLKFAGAAALALSMAVPAAAQTITSTDIQRLQDQVYDAGNEISRMRSRDAVSAERLQTRLDDLRDEVIYLRVKMRKEGSVNRNEYNDVRNQIDSIRSEARNTTDTRQGNSTWSAGGSGTGANSGYGTGSGSNAGYGSGSGSNSGYGNTQGNAPTGTVGQSGRRNEVPSGTELDVRLERELSSATAQVEDRFTATTMADLYQGNSVLIPAGSTLRGVVSSVNKATRTDRKGSMTVAFDQISVNGRAYPIHATVTQAIESEGIKGEAGKIGAGAGVGAILGGILGGAKGALLGILIGGGGTIAATEGKDVSLPAGQILRVRFEQPLQIR